tara:strand:- start:29018 stop:29389 length:372 start_codon:yes stop_codon:yes gene_type:complete
VSSEVEDALIEKLSDVDIVVLESVRDLFTSANEQLTAENKQLEADNARLSTHVCSMCNGYGVVGNILEAQDCPDCLKYNSHEDAIAEHHKRMKADNARLRELEKKHLFMIDNGLGFEDLERDL